MNRKPTRLKRSMEILKNAKASQWCYVDTENEFSFMDTIFAIDKSVKEYEVHKKAGELYDYTNEAVMEEVLAVLDSDDNLNFYDQNYNFIEPNKVVVCNEE